MMHELLGDSYTVYLADRTGNVMKRTIYPTQTSEVKVAGPMNRKRAMKFAGELDAAHHTLRGRQ
ncbi:gp218 [Mycobacterium phage Omega]|uniref:Uncharacterized protein n=2 Tax=Omegavirus TaxID=1623292 RepID=Q853U9_BPMOM|nr:gp218 [Mycobacterium phage Omega]AAN12859.1 hypothetical protein PBI_OMEGA_218 [Mycobacterium phage Omega]